jgi:serine/threonine-protein kinase RsbW
MLALEVLRRYMKSHVLIVRLNDSKYAQRRAETAIGATSEEPMHRPASGTLALRTVCLTYPGSTQHIRAVRADLRVVLRSCPMANDVILCASELAANAALHSNSCLPGGTFTVRATISPGQYIRIEVEDNGGLCTSTVSDPAQHHGLDIVRTLASEWGIVAVAL